MEGEREGEQAKRLKGRRGTSWEKVEGCRRSGVGRYGMTAHYMQTWYCKCFQIKLEPRDGSALRIRFPVPIWSCLQLLKL